MSQVRTILKILLVVLLLALGVAATYLATFDLNEYKGQLEASLSGKLEQPVRIGDLSFAWLPGPSLDCRDFEIGQPGSGRLHLQTEHFYLRLALWPLLTGRLDFSEINLQQTVVTLPESTSEIEFNLRLGEWLGDTRVERLRLSAAEIRIPERDSRPAATLLLDLSLDNLRPLRSGSLELTGELRQGDGTTPFELAGAVGFQQQLGNWRTWIFDLEGELSRLDPLELLALFRLRPPALFVKEIDRAVIELQGQPEQGLRLDLNTAGAPLTLAGRRVRDHELPPLELTVRWIAAKLQHRLENLRVALGPTELTGTASIDASGGEPRFSGRLDLAADLSDLVRLIPPSRLDSLVEHLPEVVRGGQLDASASLELPLQQLADGSALLHSLEVTAQVDDGTLDLATLGRVEALALDLDGRNGRFTVSEGHLDWQGARLTLAGSATFGEKGAGSLEVIVEGEPDAAGVLALLPAELHEDILLEGPLPTRLELAGPFSDLALHYRSDVKFLQGKFGPVYHKSSGLDGEISASARLGNGSLVIERAAISVPPFNVTGSGSVDLDGDHLLEAELELDAIDLQRAQFRSPLLARLKTRGQFTARGSLAISTTSPLKLDGRVSFEDFGLQITPVIGDLQSINGNLFFSEKSLETVLLNARLGESPITLQGGIKDFSTPDVYLELHGKRVRAQDLIFPSREMTLHDLDASLVIDRTGIDFNTITVSLPGGTKAHVQGRMEGYRGPHVALEITSKEADIDQVIALWTKAPLPRKPRNPERKPTTTNIEIHADQGRIGPFSFSDADGLLATDGRGHLVILPLNFHHAQGYGAGHILVDTTGDGPARLVVSGHVENFDAAAIYKDLLRRDGLVTGLARGDFYLQGEPGRNFLPTSSGGVSLEISEGTLRRLPLIAKVFSLLNVSQILSLNAPEMSVEGMPFDTITGSFDMRDGVLSTRDLVIHSKSMDMSLILDQDLRNQTLDGVLAVKPLKTVDSIVSNIPLVGWIIAGEDKAVLTAHFKVSGSTDDPVVTPAAAASIAEPFLGIFARTLQLPGKMITNISEALSGESNGDQEQPSGSEAPQSGPQTEP